MEKIMKYNIQKKNYLNINISLILFNLKININIFNIEILAKTIINKDSSADQIIEKIIIPRN